MSNQYWYIRNCSLFRQLDVAQLSALEACARMRTFPRGAAVFLPSDRAEGAFLLATGRIRISSTTPEGKMAVHGFIEPGELFGELSLIASGLREQRADAVLASTVILFSGNGLSALMEQSAQLSLQITKLIGLKLKRMERRLDGLLFRSNRDRLGLLLAELVEQYGKRTDEGTLINIKLSHQDLASLIGATRESVTILLGEMQHGGILKFGRQRIVVIEPTKLTPLRDAERLTRSNDNLHQPISDTMPKRANVPSKASEDSVIAEHIVKYVTDSAR